MNEWSNEHTVQKISDQKNGWIPNKAQNNTYQEHLATY